MDVSRHQNGTTALIVMCQIWRCMEDFFSGSRVPKREKMTVKSAYHQPNFIKCQVLLLCACLLLLLSQEVSQIVQTLRVCPIQNSRPHLSSSATMTRMRQPPLKVRLVWRQGPIAKGKLSNSFWCSYDLQLLTLLLLWSVKVKPNSQNFSLLTTASLIDW